MAAAALLRRATTLLRSSLVRSSGAYVGSNIANRAVPFLLIPVLTRYLSAEEMGIAAMFMLALSLAAPLVGLSTEAAVSRRFVDRDRINFARYVDTCLWLMVASGFAVLVLGWVFSAPLARLLAVPPPWIVAAILAAGGRYVFTTVLVLWQMAGRPLAYALYSFAQTAVALGLSVVLIVGFGFGWQGRAGGELVSLLLLAGIGLWILRRAGYVARKPDPEAARDATRYGTGLIPHVYGGLLIAGTDRLFITNMVGVEDTGLFVVGVQIAMIIQVFQHSVNQAWVPWVFRVYKEGGCGIERAQRIVIGYDILLVGLALALALIAPWLMGFFVGPEFRAASQFVFWLALANAFEGMYKMAAAPVYYAEMTRWLATITLLTGGANVGLNYVLISRNGALGAAQATAVAMLLSFAATAVLGRHALRTIRAARPTVVQAR